MVMFGVDCAVICLWAAAWRRSRQSMAASLTQAFKTEQQLLRSGLRFSRIFESKMIGLLFSEKSGRILDERTAVTFALDVSKRKQAEEIIARAYTDLEDRVVLRTQELQDANLELKKLVEAREEASDQMRQYQQFLDSVIENIPNMIFVKDAKDLRFVRFNRAGEDLVGHPRQALIGKNDYDFFPKDQAESFIAKDREVLKSKSMVDIPEEPLLTTTGTKFLHTKKIPIFDKQGEPLYLLGISEDITEKKLIEGQHLKLLQEQVARAEAEKGAARLAFLSEASAALNESLDLNTMLDSFARVIVAHMADWCSIALVPEESESHPLIVAHRDPVKVANALEWNRLHPTDWDSSTAVPEVVRTGTPKLFPIITDEILSTTVCSPKQVAAVKSIELRSAMIVPLRSYGQALGAISFFTSESGREFNHSDLSVAEDLAKRAFFAIENARLYKKAQEARCQSEFFPTRRAFGKSS